MTQSDLLTTCCNGSPSAALLQGIEQFNTRKYFECHETLEALWIEERAEARRAYSSTSQGSNGTGYCDNLYKGILQVGVGCYHLLRGNYHGAVVKLQSGADYLEPYAPRCMRVEVGQLIADARCLRAEVVARGPDHLADVDRALLPIIRLSDDG